MDKEKRKLKLPTIINKAFLAKIMYPNNTGATQALYNKLNANKYTRFKESDKARVIEILKDTIKEVEAIECHNH